MEDSMLVAGDVFYRNILAVNEYIKEAAHRGDHTDKVAYSTLEPDFEVQGRRKQHSDESEK